MKIRTHALNKAELLRLEYVVYATAFLVPLVLKHPQPLVGTIVNALLFVSAARLSSKHLIPLAIIPSVSAVLNGVLFGAFTPFLMYLMPFIWVGNYLQMWVFKSVKGNSALKVGLASLVKAGFLFAIAAAMVNIHVLPKIFLTAMGPLQLATALIGGVLALGILKLTESK